MSEMVKARNYDEDGFVKRAACICVNKDETEVLLVSSRRDSRLWIVPGGGVEPDELPDMAAIREVREEAGVCGMLGRCLGVFENSERGHRTSVYVLVVTEEMEEWDESRVFGRKRKWFSMEEAVEQLAKHKPVQSSYVSLLLPSGHHHHSTPSSAHSPSTCQQKMTLADPNHIIQEEVKIIQEGADTAEEKSPTDPEEVANNDDAEKEVREEEEEKGEGEGEEEGNEEEEEEEEKETDSQEPNEGVSRSRGSSQEDLSHGSVVESSANNT
ncbi:diphosphoinositol polyphosphate phosphohydrolase 1-like [Macrobrachium nipponense]|uniref:diphosphoinositol polyphosphate phosphohydrolase 1-like n=1 Tax=Macrobrachium nipponense TaxID=159736 RepID=UPI0030C7DDD4